MPGGDEVRSPKRSRTSSAADGDDDAREDGDYETVVVYCAQLHGKTGVCELSIHRSILGVLSSYERGHHELFVRPSRATVLREIGYQTSFCVKSSLDSKRPQQDRLDRIFADSAAAFVGAAEKFKHGPVVDVFCLVDLIRTSIFVLIGCWYIQQHPEAKKRESPHELRTRVFVTLISAIRQFVLDELKYVKGRLNSAEMYHFSRLVSEVIHKLEPMWDGARESMYVGSDRPTFTVEFNYKIDHDAPCEFDTFVVLHSGQRCVLFPQKFHRSIEAGLSNYAKRKIEIAGLKESGGDFSSLEAENKKFMQKTITESFLCESGEDTTRTLEQVYYVAWMFETMKIEPVPEDPPPASPVEEEEEEEEEAGVDV